MITLLLLMIILICLIRCLQSKNIIMLLVFSAIVWILGAIYLNYNFENIAKSSFNPLYNLEKKD